ncbi:glycosyltransferase family 2 protein [Geomonas paludis]|uniref:Glycosyl transferase family 2 n=1 Tax=Geomonas paludis TaxID=2740185 RepID=A0A6V8N100_9BACT|nr:glycosyltransferase family 2 protein [Geomonas paludis]GFO66071.1 glycosyl transferase family 2 [Geomonas paludis]
MQPKFSVIIPVKPGGEVRALAGLSRVTYPADLFEVLVAYGCQPSVQRNTAAREAKGEILYFLDDDSAVAPDFLDRAAAHYREQNVAAVGGPSLTPATDSPLQRAIGIAFSSAVGGGGVRNRYRKFGAARYSSDSELILCNLSFRREIFLAHEGLDERLYPNEENELMDRLQQEGHLLVHDPELAVQRSQRRTYRAYVRQMYGYGRGRGEQTLIAGKLKPITLAPSLFLVYALLVPLLIPLLGVSALPLLVYLAIVVLASMQGSLAGKDAALFPRLLLVYPTLHLVYGAGVIRGLISPRYRGGKQTHWDVEVRRVKPLGEAVQRSTFNVNGNPPISDGHPGGAAPK